MGWRGMIRDLPSNIRTNKKYITTYTSNDKITFSKITHKHYLTKCHIIIIMFMRPSIKYIPLCFQLGCFAEVCRYWYVRACVYVEEWHACVCVLDLKDFIIHIRSDVYIYIFMFIQRFPLISNWWQKISHKKRRCGVHTNTFG